MVPKTCFSHIIPLLAWQHPTPTSGLVKGIIKALHAARKAKVCLRWVVGKHQALTEKRVLQNKTSQSQSHFWLITYDWHLGCENASTNL